MRHRRPAHPSTPKRPANGRTRRGLVAVGVILAATASPTPARAQFFGPMPVVDAGAIGKLVTQLGVARDQLATLRRNMEKLGRYDLRDVRATMAQVDLVARQGEAISYSLADLERVVAETFPGAVHGGPSQADLRRQDARTLATIRGALAASRVTAQQFAAEVAALDAVKAQLRGIRTAQQAAELSGVVAVHSAEELTLLRQQLAAQANAQTVYLAYQANRATQAAAAAAAFDSAGARRPPPRARRDVYALGFEP